MKQGKPIARYSAAACLLSWLVFIPLALNHHHIIFLFPDDAAHARLQDVWHAVGAFGPVLAAIITLKLYYTKEHRRWFFRGYSVKKLTATGWLLSFSPLLLFAASLLVSRMITHSWLDVSAFVRNNKLTNPLNLLAWALPILLYGFGEEGGWRGFALPALQAKRSALKATVLLFAVWACWHLPSLFYRYHLEGAAYVGFFVGLFAGAVWLTFLYNYTRGSILAVSLWHLTFNAVSLIAKDEVVLPAVMSTLVMLLAAFVLLRYKAEELSPIRRTGLPASETMPHRSEPAAALHPTIVTRLEEKESRT